jgi:zinc/manganese transport system substrate-binding protein
MISRTLLLLTAFLLPMEALSAIRVVATTPDIAWLVNRIGGKRVEVKTLAKSSDDYHFLDARPDFILAVNRANVVCRVGADLEIGWIPKILEKAANSKVMAGGAGDCDLSRAVSVQEKPTGPIDRSMGDVHPTGNPHFWLSPLEMANAANEVEEKLTAAEPGAAAEFAANRARVQEELKSLHAKIKAMLKPLSGKTVIEYHKDFFYFNKDYGLKSLGSIEEIPGVSPSAARLGKISLEAKRAGTLIALASTHSTKSALEKFRELSGVNVVALPTSLENPADSEAYSAWQNSVAEQILKALK